MSNVVTMEQIQHEIDNLAHDMRQTNVRSLGLKVSVHVIWCQRMDRISKMLKQYKEQVTKSVKPAPPVPTE